MRVVAVAAVFVASFAIASPADEPKKADANGWIDLMKPDAWKKVDDKWIVTDEVKLARDGKGKPDAPGKGKPKH